MKIFLKKEGFFKPGVESIYVNSKNYEKEEEVVNKKIIMKGVLLLIVLAVLSMGFTGCGVVTTIFYASYIYIDSLDGIYGDVYLDGTYLGYLYPWSYVTAYNVPYGPHTVSVYPLGYFWANYTLNVSYTGQSFGIYW